MISASLGDSRVPQEESSVMGTGAPKPDVDAWLAEASRHFYERIEAAVELSRASAGQHTMERLGWSTWVFTRIVAIGVNISKLLEKGRYDGVGIDTLDYGCVGSLGRDLLETTLTFFYVSEKVSPDGWRLRKRIFDLHDCVSREQLFRFQGAVEQADMHAQTIPELKQRILREPAFHNLSALYRNKLIKGEMARVASTEDLVVAAGADFDHYKAMVKLLSANIHAIPLAWYRMDEGGRGAGVGSEVDKGYTALILDYLNGFLDAANVRMRLVLEELKGTAALC